MANYSIPNSIPVIGRTSTALSRRLRRLNSASGCSSEAYSLAKAIRSWRFGFFNAQRSTPNAQCSFQKVGYWTLGIERWAFFSFRRVKGAWWSSRSSKPLSVPHTRDRGRFDSYPLRLCLTTPVAVSLWETCASPTRRRLQQPQFGKGGDPDVA
jgi:hypothetical protein